MFDRTTDAKLTWYLDDHQCPEPAGPLAQSAYAYMFRGFERGQRARGVNKPAAIRHLFHRGYFYVYLTPPAGPLPPEAQAAARRSALTWEQEWLPEIRSNLARLNGSDLSVLPDCDLAVVLDDAVRVLARHWEIHFTLTFAVVNEFERWHRSHFPEAPAEEAQQLLQGQENASVESDRALWKLARGFDDRSLGEYLARYGQRPAVYCDLGAPTWEEDPTPVIRMLEKYKGIEDPGVHVEELAAAAAALAIQVRARLTREVRPGLNELLALALATVRMKEDHSFLIEQLTTGAVRRIVREFGRRLTAVGVLSAPEDVSLLTLAELMALGGGQVQPRLPQALEVRRATWEADRMVKPAPWLGTAPEEEELSPPAAVEWKGMGVSAGKVRGRARVAATLAEAYHLQQGEILVCRETDPGWTPLFAVAGGLVLDSFAGGMLSHAAVVAREYRLPAVVRAGGVLAAVRTGQMLEVNGTTGEVALVDDAL